LFPPLLLLVHTVWPSWSLVEFICKNQVTRLQHISVYYDLFMLHTFESLTYAPAIFFEAKFAPAMAILLLTWSLFYILVPLGLNWDSSSYISLKIFRLKLPICIGQISYPVNSSPEVFCRITVSAVQTDPILNYISCSVKLTWMHIMH
jgi:hypothetical protein